MINGGLNLGALIDAFEEQAKWGGEGTHVTFDFGGLAPEGLCSYRGYYEDLAMMFTSEQAFGEDNHTVGAMFKTLKDAVGEYFTGWKGGEYKASRESTVWVAQNGETGSTVITGIRRGDDDYIVVIETAYEEH